MKIQELHSIFLQSNGVTTDSREVRKNDLFFALKGENFDGNRFAAEALEKGAIYSVVDDPRMAKGPGFLLADDAVGSLQQLAAYHRKLFRIPVIAITGSNGKTTTKELIRDVLAVRYEVVATAGNLNNHIGVPLSLLGIKRDTEIAVIEMGANHAGEIKFLCEIAEPDYGLITNIGKAHIEGFGSLEGVARAKAELYDHLRKKNGQAFVNDSERMLMQFSEGMERIVYGEGDQAVVRGKVMERAPFLKAQISHREGTTETSTHLFGSYNLHNVLAAWCVGMHFSVSPIDITGIIRNYKPSNLRSQVVDTGKNLLIMDTYNANPDSMILALNDFASLGAEKKLLIIGDMRELGESEEEEHRKVMERVSEADQVIFVGPVFYATVNDTPHTRFIDIEDAMTWIRSQDLRGYTIFVKGSRKIGLERLLPFL